MREQSEEVRLLLVGLLASHLDMGDQAWPQNPLLQVNIYAAKTFYSLLANQRGSK